MSTLFGKTEDNFPHIFNLIGADLYCNWLTDVKYLVLGIFICGNFAWILLYGHLSRDAILRIRQHFNTFSIASIIMHVFFMSHDKVIKCINSRTYFRLVSIIDINHFLVQFFLLIQLHPKAYAHEYQYFPSNIWNGPITNY